MEDNSKLEREFILALENNSQDELKKIFEDLVKKSEKSENRLERIIKQSDKQHLELIKLNEELDTYKKHLENKVEIATKDIKELNIEIENTQKEIIFRMGAIGESRSIETGKHVKRVAEYSRLLAILYGLSEEEAELLRVVSPMHDIGKVAIPDSILSKPGKLNDEEYEIMKTHTTIGYDILGGTDKELFKAAQIVAYQHHEKWEGGGYPRGIAKEDIHIFARITTLSDIFDALGSERCYKQRWEDSKVFEYIQKESGKTFEPTLVELFMEHKEKFLEIRDKYKDEFSVIY